MTGNKMNEELIQNQIDDINRKLDVILEEMERQRAHRQEMEDLKDDLTRIGNDLFKTAVEEFEEMSDSIDTGDFWHLTKKLMRNVKNLNAAFEQFESIRDFANDAMPLSREMFIDFMNKLDEFDKKGYFTFIIEGQKIIDKIVTSYTVEDVRKLGENITNIVDTIKNLTQPDMLHAVNNALVVYKNLDTIEIENKSLFTLMRELNTPEMKRGLAFMFNFLKSLSEHSFNNQLERSNNNG